MRFFRDKMEIENVILSEDDALAFVEKYGCVTLFPIKNVKFPNLYQAIKGTSQYKYSKAWLFADTLALDKKVHYVKLVSNKITLMSIDMLRYFYNLYGNEFKPANPIQVAILELLGEEGPKSTKEIKKVLQLTTDYESKEFGKAIGALWNNFRIAVVGKVEEPVRYYWDLIEKWYDPSILEPSDFNKENLKKEILFLVSEKINWLSKTKLKTLLRLF